MVGLNGVWIVGTNRLGADRSPQWSPTGGSMQSDDDCIALGRRSDRGRARTATGRRRRRGTRRDLRRGCTARGRPGGERRCLRSPAGAVRAGQVRCSAGPPEDEVGGHKAGRDPRVAASAVPRQRRLRDRPDRRGPAPALPRGDPRERLAERARPGDPGRGSRRKFRGSRFRGLVQRPPGGDRPGLPGRARRCRRGRGERRPRRRANAADRRRGAGRHRPAGRRAGRLALGAGHRRVPARAARTGVRQVHYT